jgi:BlaI family penicillinase repressor
MKELTKAEEQVMQVLWELKKGFIKDIIAQLPKPEPAYTTVSTIVRILEEKGFVTHKAYGKTHEYHPLVYKKEYRSFAFKNIFKNYFNGSAENLMSYFVKENDIDIKDLNEILKTINKKKTNE